MHANQNGAFSYLHTYRYNLNTQYSITYKLLNFATQNTYKQQKQILV